MLPIIEVFDQIDENGDGNLDKEEILKVLPPDDQNWELIDQVFEAIDVDENGKISYTEFLAAMYSKTQLKENNLRDAFNFFDKDGDGEITLAEMSEYLKN